MRGLVRGVVWESGRRWRFEGAGGGGGGGGDGVDPGAGEGELVRGRGGGHFRRGNVVGVERGRAGGEKR